MCLQVKNIPDDLNPEVAVEDIPCYKVLQVVSDFSENCYIRTPYQKFKIEFCEGRCYLKADQMTGYYFAIQGTLFQSLLAISTKQSYSNLFNLKWIYGKNITECCKLGNPTIEYLNVYEGFHAYLKPRYSSVICHPDMYTFKAIIPKGAHYFIGYSDDIVADKMIIFNEIINYSR